ncbi:uncharacterized protein TNCV_282311 [Trichonephila clavipes]|nr:uncharacterized protein TNCV_282311 [Trichonephila clavipes]
MQEFHDLPLAGHLGKRKTYLKMRDTCYFPYMRKYIFEYVSTCDWCQKFNYKNALPAGRLIPIVSNYHNDIVTLDLLGPYPASRPERYRFLLVITDHFTKWSELIPLRKASAQAMATVAKWYRYRTVACFVTGSSPVPLKTRRVGQRCTLNLSRAETSSRWCGVVVRRGGCQLRCRPRHLTMVQNYVVRRQKPSCS